MLRYSWQQQYCDSVIHHLTALYMSEILECVEIRVGLSLYDIERLSG